MTSSNSSIDNKGNVQHHEAIHLDATDEAIAQTAAKMHVHTTASTAHKINPVPIGFGGFALCSFILGIYNSGLLLNLPHVAVGVAFGYGALGQFICGITELILGNTFAATTMLTFCGFFITFGIMIIPSSGVFAFVMENGGIEVFHEIMGLIQLAFSFASLIFFIGTLRQPILIRLTLFQVFLTFFLGGVGGLTGIHNLTIAGGWVSFTLSITAWYIMAAILYTPDHTFVKLPFF